MYNCPKCQREFKYTSSEPNERFPTDDGGEVDIWTCPDCQYRWGHVLVSPFKVKYFDPRVERECESTELAKNPEAAYRQILIGRTWKETKGFKFISGESTSIYD